MRSMALCVASAILFAVESYAQTIPNAGFETWSIGNPASWLTSNIPPLLTNVTQSTDAHGGSSAARGEVVLFGGVPFGALLYSGPSGQGFPINSRPAALHGWYKFTPVGGDNISVVLGFKRNGTGMGFGNFTTSSPQATYREFIANITYNTSDIPDTVLITVAMSNGSTLHVGSVFLLDDLSYGPASDVKELPGSRPRSFALEQNFPNPFNPTTRIQFQVPDERFVTLKVFNLLGEEVATLVNERLSRGQYKAELNANNLSSGTYFYRLQAGGYVAMKKMILMR